MAPSTTTDTYHPPLPPPPITHQPHCHPPSGLCSYGRCLQCDLGSLQSSERFLHKQQLVIHTLLSLCCAHVSLLSQTSALNLTFLPLLISLSSLYISPYCDQAPLPSMWAPLHDCGKTTPTCNTFQYSRTTCSSKTRFVSGILGKRETQSKVMHVWHKADRFALGLADSTFSLSLFPRDSCL